MKKLMNFAALAAIATLPATVWGNPSAAVSAPPHPAPAENATKAPEPLTGKVLQTMDSAGYTYVLLETGGKQIWVAAPQAKVKVGETVTFKAGQEMANFPSSTLKKTFDRITFSEGLMNPSAASQEEKSPGSGGAAVSGDAKVKVEKATGADAYTIADLYGKSGKLNKKKVAVRGKVVKVSAGIMSRNWIHLQDGSGSAKKKTNNLVVTSKDLPTVGDVVTARGVLAKDKEFGPNYKYKVIIENATVTP